MDGCCQRCDNDAERCQGLSRISPVNKGRSGWDGDVGTARLGINFCFGGIPGVPKSRNESCKCGIIQLEERDSLHGILESRGDCRRY